MSAQNQPQRVQVEQLEVEFTPMRGKLIVGIYAVGAEDPRAVLPVSPAVAEVLKAFGIVVPETVQQPVYELPRQPIQAKPLVTNDVPSLSAPAPAPVAAPAPAPAPVVKAQPEQKARKGPQIGIWIPGGKVKVAAGGKLKFIYPDGSDLNGPHGRLYLGSMPLFTGQQVEYKLGPNRGDNAEKHPYVVVDVRFERPAAQFAEQLREIKPVSGKISKWSAADRGPGSGEIDATLENGKKIKAQFDALEIEDPAIDPTRDIVGMDITCKVIKTGEGKVATYVAYCLNSRLVMTVEVAHNGTTDKTYDLGDGLIMDAPGVRVFTMLDPNTAIMADGTVLKTERKGPKLIPAKDRVRWTRVLKTGQIDVWFSSGKVDSARYPGLKEEIKASLAAYVASIRTAYAKPEAERSQPEKDLLAAARVRSAHEVLVQTPEGLIAPEDLISEWVAYFWTVAAVGESIVKMPMTLEVSGNIMVDGNALGLIKPAANDAEFVAEVASVASLVLNQDVPASEIEEILAAVRAERCAPAPKAEQQPAQTEAPAAADEEQAEPAETQAEPAAKPAKKGKKAPAPAEAQPEQAEGGVALAAD